MLAGFKSRWTIPFRGRTPAPRRSAGPGASLLPLAAAHTIPSRGNVLHHQEARPSMNRRDVGMIERCQHLRFTLETLQAFGVVGKSYSQRLESHVAIQSRVV